MPGIITAFESGVDVRIRGEIMVPVQYVTGEGQSLRQFCSGARNELVSKVVVVLGEFLERSVVVSHGQLHQHQNPYFYYIRCNSSEAAAALAQALNNASTSDVLAS